MGKKKKQRREQMVEMQRWQDKMEGKENCKHYLKSVFILSISTQPESLQEHQTCCCKGWGWLGISTSDPWTSPAAQTAQEDPKDLMTPGHITDEDYINCVAYIHPYLEQSQCTITAKFKVSSGLLQVLQNIRRKENKIQTEHILKYEKENSSMI